jgi:hypothetical protein
MDQGQRVRARLQNFPVEGVLLFEIKRGNWLARKKIEVYGFAVSQPQSKGGAPVKHASGKSRLDSRFPESALHGRQHIQMPIHHGAQAMGCGGRGGMVWRFNFLCQKTQDLASKTPRGGLSKTSEKI